MRTPLVDARYYVVALLAVGACKSDEKTKPAETASAKPVEAAPAKAVEPPAKPVEAAKPALPPPPAVPCSGPAIAELAKQLQTANGFNVDYSDVEAGKAKVAAAIASIDGKRLAFTGCAFKSQGNDEVSFAPRADSPYEQQITCKMAGGEAGNEKFRNAAMTLDTAKMKLDVIGTVGGYKDSRDSTSYSLTECTITAHE